MKWAIRLTRREKDRGRLDPARRDRAARLFRKHGALVLRGALPVELVNRMRRAYAAAYIRGWDDSLAARLDTGHRRRMVTVRIAPPFNDPAVYAAPPFYKVLKRLLGRWFVINSFGSVTAWPGAEAQHTHVDHPPLFEDKRWDASIPPYAVTVVIPLVPLNPVNGGTMVYERSQSIAEFEKLKGKPELVRADIGDCYLMDYRLWHGGSPTRGTKPRPILYVVYSRPWFRDVVNFYKQAPLLISASEFKKVPARYKHLFWLTRGRKS